VDALRLSRLRNLSSYWAKIGLRRAHIRHRHIRHRHIRRARPALT